MTKPENIELFLAENAYSEATRRSYRYALKRFIRECEIFEFLESFQALEPVSFRKWLFSHDWNSNSRWLYYSAVRAYIKWKFDDDHPALRLRIKRNASAPQRTLTLKQAEEIYQYLEKIETPKGIRDLAIYSLALDTGLRASEICNIDISRIDFEHRMVTVKVKGGDWGLAIFSPITAQNLRKWLEVRSDYVKDAEALFVGIKGVKPGSRMTSDGLRGIVRKWGKKTGVGKLSPHDFRRTFAIISTLNQAPTRLVQMAGRWKNIKEVQRYTRGLRLKEFDRYLPMREVAN